MASSSERVVDLLNDASLSRDPGEKLRQLQIVQEILIHQEPNLLDNFLDEVMGFQKDRSQDVRKFVVGFIEEACQKDPETLAKVIANLQMMMSDSAVTIQKRVIQAMTHLYKVALMWLAQAKIITEDMEAVWTVVCGIKSIITHLLEADNDGIRTHTVKFMEMLVITQTLKEAESVSKAKEFSLDQVPLALKIVKRRKLEEEAKHVFEEMVQYHQSAHISAANLMTCMGALTNIAKSRPQFMSKVITTLEMLHANLPPTLAKSQVSSVRKHLKNQLLALLRHPVAAENYFTNITTLLTDLGASREEVMRAMPKYEEMRKKVKRAQEKAAAAAAAAASSADLGESEPKKRRVVEEDDERDGDEDDDGEDDVEEDEEEREERTKARAAKFSHLQVESAVDITEKFIKERLTPAFATELVMQSMHMLPREIPPHFHNTYTPIAAAGTEGQVKHVSRLLATQLTQANLGPGISAVKEKREREYEDDDIKDDDEDGAASKTISVIGTRTNTIKVEKTKKKVTLMPAGMSKKSTRVRAVRLADMTKPLGPLEKNQMMAGALRRILKAEKTAKVGGVCPKRTKIIASLVTQCPQDLKRMVMDFIFEDVQTRTELAFSWLFEEYCFFQGFNKSSTLYNKRNDDSEYNALLCSLIKSVMDRTLGMEREDLLRRLYLESPIITEDAIHLLKQFILMEDTAMTVVHLMKDLVMRRPTKKLNFLNFLLEFCSHDNPNVREMANQTVLQLHGNGDYNDIIEDYSIMYLRFLLSPIPPSMLFGEDRGRAVIAENWSDDIIRVCLYLFLSLLPLNLKMFTHLADVYVAASGDIKRTILRVLEAPVKSISMANPDLLTIIEKCPKGSETLVTRIIHILTETEKPSPELVEKVRDLYEKRVSDVRFLIPVLNGLAKTEIVNALPKLIRLNPAVVKEVFNRILSTKNNGPMTPAELMIVLHVIDPQKCDTKTVISATTLCFQDRKTFNQETLAIVLQQLMERPNIPLLFMRTVIQSVKIYPKMIGFVMNVLQRLILKQVWKQKQIWDGFIKCCEKTVPQSYAVMLQLPPPQLASLLDAVPFIRDPLLVHVQDFTDEQRQHVSSKIMAVLYNETKMETKEEEQTSKVDSVKQEESGDVVGQEN